MLKRKKEKEKKSFKEELIKELRKELNIGEENKEKPEEAPVYVPKEKTEEDLIKIRQSFAIIFIVATFLGVFYISSFMLSNKKPLKKPKDKTEIKVEEEDLKSIPLKALKDGEIPLVNLELLDLFKQVKYNHEEYFLYDSNFLYRMDIGKTLTVSKLSDDYLLFLLSKSNVFNNYINNLDLLTKAEVCLKDGSIRIPRAEIDEMLLENLNVTNINYSDFIFSYYVNKNFITYIKFVYSDDYYVSFCYDQKDFNFSSISDVLIDNAVKEKKQITIDIKAVFQFKEKIFSDYNLSNYIGSVEEEMLNYIKNGSSYRLLYKESKEGNYYLYSISRID